jgi:hypothetical protein
MSTFTNNPFASKVTVTQGTSKSQASYNEIGSSNRIHVSIIGGTTTRRVSRGSEDSSMAGVVCHHEGVAYPVSIEPILGNIVSFNGAGQVSTYYYGDVIKGDYSKVLGMTIAIHTTEEECDLINQAMTHYGVNAVEVTFDVSPLNIWLGKDGYSAKAFGKVVHIEPKALDITVATVDINTVDGEKNRDMQAQKRAASSYTKRQAINMAKKAPTLNLDLPRPVTTNVEG